MSTIRFELDEATNQTASVGNDMIISSKVPPNFNSKKKPLLRRTSTNASTTKKSTPPTATFRSLNNLLSFLVEDLPISAENAELQQSTKFPNLSRSDFDFEQFVAADRIGNQNVAANSASSSSASSSSTSVFVPNGISGEESETQKFVSQDHTFVHRLWKNLGTAEAKSLARALAFRSIIEFLDLVYCS